jgi:DNA adenine methylase
LEEQMTKNEGSRVRPPYRWVGGKQRVEKQLVDEWIPPIESGYAEPFLGAGTAFIGLMNRGRIPVGAQVTLSDANWRVARTWRGIQEDPDLVIELLRERIEGHSAAAFLAARREDVDDYPDAAEVAAWMMYLCSVSYNGLYRTNKKGVFNAAMDAARDPALQIDLENVRRLSVILTGVEVGCMDFEDVFEAARPGWVVYADPPYHGQYDRHNGKGFTPDDRVRLRDAAVAAHRRGAQVVINDADAPETRELYAVRLGFQVTAAVAPSSVSITTEGRGSARILVARLLH